MQSTPKVRRVRKLWHKGLRSLPAIDGKRYRVGEEIKPLLDGLNVEFDVTPDEEVTLARALKDDTLAKRLLSMRQKNYPYATIPELIMTDYLDKVGERYAWQAQIYGGWRSGGLIPDYVLLRTGRAILVQGSFWHNVPGKKEKDAADKLRLTGAYFEGTKITDVVYVWESKLMAPGRDRVMQDAIQGVESGQ